MLSVSFLWIRNNAVFGTVILPCFIEEDSDWTNIYCKHFREQQQIAGKFPVSCLETCSIFCVKKIQVIHNHVTTNLQTSETWEILAGVVCSLSLRFFVWRETLDCPATGSETCTSLTLASPQSGHDIEQRYRVAVRLISRYNWACAYCLPLSDGWLL